jgi:recombination protein RecT
MSEQTALVKQKKDVLAFLSREGLKTEVAKVLPKHITAERMLRVLTTSVLHKPELIQAASVPIGQASLLHALMVCGQAGLEPDSRNAHLIPFWSSEAGCYTVQVIFDWKGLVALGLRSGFDLVYADYACEAELNSGGFNAWVEDGKKRLIHRIDWVRPRGEPKLFYAVTRRGDVLDWEIMTLEETEDIRNRSKAKNKGPWVTDTLEMRKKCPIRRMSKRWDLDPDIREVINAEDDQPPAIEVAASASGSKPLFQQPKDLVEESLANGVAAIEGKGLKSIAPTDPEVPFEAIQPDAPADDGGLGPQPAAKGPSRPVDDLRALCVRDKVSEGSVLDFLVKFGTTDGSVSSLDELAMLRPDVVGMLISTWADVRGKLKAGKKG